jgi:methanogenic corrinoid protein MtbC1
MEEIIAPLLVQIGDRWRDGTLRVASEHLASATVRTLLGLMNGAFPSTPGAPRLVVTTPAGQLHELGALLAATVAASEGWHAAYLGPSLPAEEIAAAAERVGARAVALSIIFPDDTHLSSELRRLMQLVPEETAVLVGGRGAVHYSDLLEELGASHISDLPSFRMVLASLRPPHSPRSAGA